MKAKSSDHSCCLFSASLSVAEHIGSFLQTLNVPNVKSLNDETADLSCRFKLPSAVGELEPNQLVSISQNGGVPSVEMILYGLRFFMCQKSSILKRKTSFSTVKISEQFVYFG